MQPQLELKFSTALAHENGQMPRIWRLAADYGKSGNQSSACHYSHLPLFLLSSFLQTGCSASRAQIEPTAL
jgi:hypothetical protein